jgi:uncharacterized iron-regulated membrane protein
VAGVALILVAAAVLGFLLYRRKKRQRGLPLVKQDAEGKAFDADGSSAVSVSSGGGGSSRFICVECFWFGEYFVMEGEEAELARLVEQRGRRLMPIRAAPSADRRRKVRCFF